MVTCGEEKYESSEGGGGGGDRGTRPGEHTLHIIVEPGIMVASINEDIR